MEKLALGISMISLAYIVILWAIWRLPTLLKMYVIYPLRHVSLTLFIKRLKAKMLLVKPWRRANCTDHYHCIQ